jgi:hypothetical protein
VLSISATGTHRGNWDKIVTMDRRWAGKKDGGSLHTGLEFEDERNVVLVVDRLWVKNF